MPKVVVKSGAVVELVLGSGEGWLQFFVAQEFGDSEIGGPESVVGIIIFISSSQDFL